MNARKRNMIDLITSHSSNGQYIYGTLSLQHLISFMLLSVFVAVMFALTIDVTRASPTPFHPRATFTYSKF